jgi:hypothetical protein
MKYPIINTQMCLKCVSVSCCSCAVPQETLKAYLQQQGTWPLWEGTWADQHKSTLVFKMAYIPGNTRVMSREYMRSQTRNGCRVQIQLPSSSGVMQPHACEVLRLIQLQPRGARSVAGSGSSSSSGGGSSSGAAAGQQGSSQSCGAELLVFVRRFNTVVRTDQPELAEVLMEAKKGDFCDPPFVIQWVAKRI